ncbi:hypothetical protein CHELA20_50372 [Hyphomicrobiales bacterium]|nr:hypothetical protein CHELA41_20003 [Hyphomicrobiales bacterium]CAH1668580.1 hypothetical protein CHELA20_50372 [Hyphomicrobiales bacterium]
MEVSAETRHSGRTPSVSRILEWGGSIGVRTWDRVGAARVLRKGLAGETAGRYVNFRNF